MATYNGHKNRRYWNVSLWLFNDEGLYRMMQDHVTRAILADLPATTPDGERYTFNAVRAALVGV